MHCILKILTLIDMTTIKNIGGKGHVDDFILFRIAIHQVVVGSSI